MSRTHVSLAGIAIAAILLIPVTAPLAASSSQSNGNAKAQTSVVDTLLALLGLSALSGDPGQPNQSCEETPNQPGNSISAPGSAFNPDGKAGTVYAGEQPQNSKNPKSVSQYDVACARPQH